MKPIISVEFKVIRNENTLTNGKDVLIIRDKTNYGD